VAFQPVPSYAEVSYSYYDEREQKTKSKFNPVWLSWFISLNGFVTTGIVASAELTESELIVGASLNSVRSLGDLGSAGDVLTSQGVGLDPVWAAPTAVAGMPDDTILANISGGVATGSPETLSDILDAIVSSAQGTLLTRGAAGWVALAPGAAGTVLTANGAGADLTWV
jgi:hypothetical protein